MIKDYTKYELTGREKRIFYFAGYGTVFLVYTCFITVYCFRQFRDAWCTFCSLLWKDSLQKEG